MESLSWIKANTQEECDKFGVKCQNVIVYKNEKVQMGEGGFGKGVEGVKWGEKFDF